MDSRNLDAFEAANHRLPIRSGVIRSGTLIIIAAMMLLTAGLQAQNYSIDWHKIAGGGGTSTNGQYSISGTIGQHDASGPLTGGGYSVTGGFWSLLTAVQTPGAPLLSIWLTGTNTAVVSWPVSGTTFTLQQNANLGVPSWSTVTNAVSVVSGQNHVIVPLTAHTLCFRLKYP